MTREERENILDKHKHVYDGYVTEYVKQNSHPLFVQSYANDKNGITVNNRGDVGHYRNTNINEDIYSGAKFEPEETFEGSFVSLGLKKDMIADRPGDMKHGTFEDEDESYDLCVACKGMGFDELTGMECGECHGAGCGTPLSKEKSEHSSVDFDELFELESDDTDMIKEDVKRTINMFNRIIKF